MGVKCSKQPKLMPIILEEDEIELSSVSPPDNFDDSGFIKFEKKFEQLKRPDDVSCLFSLELKDNCGVKRLVLAAIDIDEAIITKQKVVQNVDVKNKIKDLANLL